MGQRRRRAKQSATFEERSAIEAQKFKEAAAELPAGSTARELLLRRFRQLEAASDMNEALKSPIAPSPE